jgi:hypothetical protein
MYGLMTTTDATRAREAVDRAFREHTNCRMCGEAMRLDERNGGLWIECASLRSRTGLRLWIEQGLHDRHRIDLPETEPVLAAA